MSIQETKDQQIGKAQIIINEYLSGNLTAIKRELKLKTIGVHLYYLNRGKGRITAWLSLDGKDKIQVRF